LVAAVIAIAIWSIFQNGIKQGLDLKAGTSFELQWTFSKIDSTGRGTALVKRLDILRKPLIASALSEPTITQSAGRILVQCRASRNPNGMKLARPSKKAAYLEFR